MKEEERERERDLQDTDESHDHVFSSYWNLGGFVSEGEEGGGLAEGRGPLFFACPSCRSREEFFAPRFVVVSVSFARVCVVSGGPSFLCCGTASLTRFFWLLARFDRFSLLPRFVVLVSRR